MFKRHAQTIVKARERAGLSQAEVAVRMGVEQPVVSRLESGNHVPSVRTLQRFAEAIECRLFIAFIQRRK